MLAVADIDLIKLDLGLLLTAVESAMRRGGGLESLTSLRRDSARGAIEAGAEQPIRREVTSALPVTAETSQTPLEAVAESLPPRLNADTETVENGLARLVLTLIEVLRKVLEHQAIRRMEGGHLTAEEIERLGVALLRLNDRMQEMKGVFGLKDEDLQIDLGPLGRLR
jgi:hypothetical protein